MSRPSRWVVALVAALTALAIAPAIAAAKTSSKHHLKSYRVEKHLTIAELETEHVQLSCQAGDIVTDGMWRVDEPSASQVNQQLLDPDELPFDERDVDVQRSQAIDVRTWAFSIENTASEDAQVKLFLVCLDGSTVSGSHNHAINTTSNYTFASGAQEPHGYTHASGSCAANEVFIAPGFRILQGKAKPFASTPSGNLRQWTFGFWITDVNQATHIEVTGRCLATKTGLKSGHLHKLFPSRHSAPVERFDRGNGVSEHSLSCAEDAKGLVGGYDLFHPAFAWHDFGWHWLGMDPRPKSRSYKTHSTGSGGTYYLVCFKDRVSRPLKS